MASRRGDGPVRNARWTGRAPNERRSCTVRARPPAVGEQPAFAREEHTMQRRRPPYPASRGLSLSSSALRLASRWRSPSRTPSESRIRRPPSLGPSPASAPTSSPWTSVTHQPDFLLDGASSPILLTDGSVLIQDAGFPHWWRLTPDEFGSYGTAPGHRSPRCRPRTARSTIPRPCSRTGGSSSKEANTSSRWIRPSSSPPGRTRERSTTRSRAAGRWCNHRRGGEPSATRRVSRSPAGRACGQLLYDRDGPARRHNLDLDPTSRKFHITDEKAGRSSLTAGC